MRQRVLFVVVVPRLAVPFGSASVARLGSHDGPPEKES